MHMFAKKLHHERQPEELHSTGNMQVPIFVANGKQLRRGEVVTTDYVHDDVIVEFLHVLTHVVGFRHVAHDMCMMHPCSILA
jgi:predicted Zn-dependent protease